MALAVSCGGDTSSPPPPPLRLSSITIDGGSRLVELDTTFTLTVTARDTAAQVVSVPVVWKSTADTILSIDRDGKATARDTGEVNVTASSLGVTSGPIAIRVVWIGPAKAAAFAFSPPLAISPGTDVLDSIRVQVTTLNANVPAVGAKVAFAVTAGGGSVSPTIATAGQNGVAATKWIPGPTAGVNTVTATVVGADSLPLEKVKDHPTFTIKTYTPLVITQGDGQSGNVLSALPTVPIVKLVDTAGKPRAGIPVTFTPTGNGRVANATASTASDGTASPGIWTLGDATGDEQLVVTVEAAKVALHATATGNTVRYPASHAATAQAATCAIASDQTVSCLGQAPLIGTGDTTGSKSTPTLTKGGLHFTSVVGGTTHFCGIATDVSIYCWGTYALVDSVNGLTEGGNSPVTVVPTRLQSNIAWTQVATGAQHNCALANDHTAYCWGIDTTGQLGDNALTRHLTPKPVSGGFAFNSLTAGSSHTCGITADGTALCWGLNSSGQLGDGTTVNRNSPTTVSGGLKWKALGAGQAWTCGLTVGGTPYCWGAGTGHQTPTSYTIAPVFSSLSVGTAHACALTDAGVAYCWGDNSGGQLGDSTTTFRDSPVAVATDLRFASISAGYLHTCGITVDGLLACWGRNTVGEIGLTTPTLQTTPRYVVVGVQP